MFRHRFLHRRIEGVVGSPSLGIATVLWALVRLLRPEQWTKNGLVFAALLFSGRLRDPASAGLAALAFAGFCLASSSIYSLNDALDAREDRLHPRKRTRPVAAGIIGPGLAIAVSTILAAAAIYIGFLVNIALGLTIVLYLGIHVLYCFVLKHVVLLDVMAVAAGFVLRAVGGGVAIAVELSLWFLVSVPLLSLFLAVAKRRHELLSVEEAAHHRPVLTEYSAQLLDQMLAVLSAAVIMAYLLYAKDTIRPHLFILTSPLVIYGVFRYLYLVYRRSEGGSPDELLLTDVPLLVTVLLWVAAVATIIYFM
ncbi:MAG: decaprenyl-phosphate phosphoribosyltransferase [bacterium]